MSKADVIIRVRERLQEQYERMAGAALNSHSYATDRDSKAESKYDTRSLEASYLAMGQAEKAEEIAAAITYFEELNPSPFADTDAINLGALVEADLSGELCFYLIAPFGGGVVCDHEGCDLTVLTPDSPLGRQLIGRHAGDCIEELALTIFEVS